jgi:DnaJ-class molecular chaperone
MINLVTRHLARVPVAFGGGQNMNMDDIFSMFGDIFGGHFGGGGQGGFGGGFGGFSGGQARGARGSNLRVKVNSTLEEIANGVEKKIKIRRNVPADGVSFKTCPVCKGHRSGAACYQYHSGANAHGKHLPQLPRQW